MLCALESGTSMTRDEDRRKIRIALAQQAWRAIPTRDRWALTMKAKIAAYYNVSEEDLRDDPR